MARRTGIRAPTSASLPDSLRIPSDTASLVKTLGRLSRASLINIALQWLDNKQSTLFPPYLRSHEQKQSANTGQEEDDDDDDVSPYPPAKTLQELRSVYEDLHDRKGGKREVIDRILEGDWRHGISLRQLAMIDMRYIEDHRHVGQRWTALRLVRTTRASTPTNTEFQPCSEENCLLLRFNSFTFLKALQREISPLVKAHYHVYRSKTLPLTIVRILVLDSPYQVPRQSPHVFIDSSRIMYLAFPDSSPFIYFSLSGSSRSALNKMKPSLTTDTLTLRGLVKDAVPKALSRPQQRYTLKSTSLTAKSLHTLLALRGPERTNSANGAFAIFADAVVEGGPLDPRLPESVNPAKYAHNSAKVPGATPSGMEGSSTRDDLRGKENVYPKPATSKALTPQDEIENMHVAKKRKLAVCSRFGSLGQTCNIFLSSTSEEMQVTNVAATTSTAASAKVQNAAHPTLDRLEIYLQDPIVGRWSNASTAASNVAREREADDNNNNNNNEEEEEDDQHRTTLTLTFTGPDVISGFRQLAELGVIDPDRMPAWMTGEEGVSSAVIRGGKRQMKRKRRAEDG